MGKSIPGSCGYPIVSDKSIEFASNPQKFVQSRINNFSSRIFQTRILNHATIVLCSPHHVKEMLTERSNDLEHGYKSFLYRLYGDNLLFENGESAMHLRLCLVPLFQNVGNYQQTIEGLTIPFIDSIQKRTTPINVYKEFKSLMTTMCLQLFLGLNEDNSTQISNTISQLATEQWHGIISVPVNIRIPLSGPSTFNIAVEAKEKLQLHIKRIISKNQPQLSNGNKSVLDRMRESVFPHDGAMEQHLLLFVSAIIPKAFASIITSFIAAMSGEKMKDQRSKARVDPVYLNHCLLEVQRLWPPIFGGRRLVKRDTTIDGHKIPKGYALCYMTQPAHRDSEVFPKPNQFNPERWSTCNAGQEDLLFCFGAGPRSCVGTKFIQSIIYDVALRLLRAYDWELSPANQDLTYKYLPVARPNNPPTVRFCPLSDVTA